MAQWFALQDAPLRLTARGHWLHGDDVLPPKLAHLFSQHVEPTGPDAWQVRLGYERAPVAVDDAGFWVRRQELVVRAGVLVDVTLWLSDGAQERLDPRTLMQAKDWTFYCAVVRNGFCAPCRFQPAHYHELAHHIDPAGDKDDARTSYLLRLGTKRYGIGSYAREVRAVQPLGDL